MKTFFAAFLMSVYTLPLLCAAQKKQPLQSRMPIRHLERTNFIRQTFGSLTPDEIKVCLSDPMRIYNDGLKRFLPADNHEKLSEKDIIECQQVCINYTNAVHEFLLLKVASESQYNQDLGSALN